LNAGKAANKKEQLPGRNLICLFLKAAFLITKQPGLPLLSYSKITIRAQRIMQNSVPCHVPGHADFVASKKFGGFEDYRGGGHFSGRLTVCLVAVGVVAKRLLSASSKGEINITASIVEIGGETDLEKGLQRAIDAKDSIGGIVECRVNNLPLGLGEPFFDSAESLLAHAVFAIPAVKGIEFGAGFAAAKMFGSEHNDAIEDATGKTKTNHAGGIVGGITNWQ
jgi:chorismate synthase